MIDPIMRTFVVVFTLGLILLLLGRAAWLDGLYDSWNRGGPGTRHAADAEMSRGWIALTGSVVIPERMD